MKNKLAVLMFSSMLLLLGCKQPTKAITEQVKEEAIQLKQQIGMLSSIKLDHKYRITLKMKITSINIHNNREYSISGPQAAIDSDAIEKIEEIK